MKKLLKPTIFTPALLGLILSQSAMAEMSVIPDKTLSPAISTKSLKEVVWVNLNTATESQLAALPGIGKTKAKAIVAYRDKYGLFQSTEDVMKVKGIGEKIYAKMKSQLSVK